jgi:hypothetical protein
MKIFSILTFVLAGACALDTKEGLPVEPPFAGGKADVGDRVTDMGPLGFGAESAPASRFVEDLEFHGYRLAVRAGAIVTLDVTQRGSSRSVDTTLFVYGPETGDGFGSSAIASDDDAGWGRLSRLTRLALTPGGSYLVVIGTHDARGRGNYRLQASCESGDCAPLPAETGCHRDLRAAIDRCLADTFENDTEWYFTRTRRDVVEQCSDVEVLAPARDALCAASPTTSLCALAIEELGTGYAAMCRAEAWNAMLDEQCVFGDRYRDLFKPGPLVIVERSVLTAASTLDALRSQQIVTALHASSHDDVTTPAEAFDRVDENEIFATEVWDASNRRAFTAYEFGAGDNSFGMIFDFGATTMAARINDGDFYDCNVHFGPEMRECATDADCAEGLRCHGVAEEIERGRCIDYEAPEHSAEDTSCTLESACPAGSGLLCAGAPTSGDGLCRPAWLQGRFVVASSQAIPDRGTIEVPIVAFGLATVDVDVYLDLSISHPRPSDLRVALVNPAGTEAVVFDHASDGAALSSDGVLVRGFSGDETVNGTWRLVISDTVSGQTGAVSDVGLVVTSRWD